MHVQAIILGTRQLHLNRLQDCTCSLSFSSLLSLFISPQALPVFYYHILFLQVPTNPLTLHFSWEEAMNKFKKSQILLLLIISLLLVITPLLSSSLRSTYLYFVFNIFIIALGAEAGFLSAFSQPAEEKNKKHYVSAASKTMAATTKASPDEAAPTDGNEKAATTETCEKKPKVVEKSASEKKIGNVKVGKVKKCPSTPSLFFIGSGDGEAEEAAKEEIFEEIEEEVGGLDRQELFTKAETFIGNFYKQLKMQREESWKRIHGFYQKAF